jgi:sugar/nucleoside kinase (ribokinase family)
MSEGRDGVLACGSFIVDITKTIDRWPDQDTLVEILDEVKGNGGGAFNVLADLRALGWQGPLEAWGAAGEDSAGDWIAGQLDQMSVDFSRLQRIAGRPTSYTDVMTVRGTGRRTFFHQIGANSLFEALPEGVTESRAEIFYYGYLLLLPGMDELLPGGETRAARVLQAACEAGMTTVVDAVSLPHNDYAPVVASVLPWVDWLVINETEAGWAVGKELSGLSVDGPEVGEAARELLAGGLRHGVVIHSPMAALCVTPSGDELLQSSVAVPPEAVAGTAGAGDAFAAGFILGQLRGVDLSASLRYGMAAAAASLTHPSASAGVMPLGECLEQANRWGWRSSSSSRPC